MKDDLTSEPTAEQSRPRHSGRGTNRRTLLFQASSVFAAIVILTLHLQFGTVIRTTVESWLASRPQAPATLVPAGPSEPRKEEASSVSVVEETPEPDPAPKPASPPPLDRAAIAKAEATLDSVSRDRARAEARLHAASKLFEEASQRAALEASLSKTLAFRIRDPSAQITRTISRGGFIRSDVQKLEKEVAALRRMPRAKATSIISRTPVAKAAQNDEFHFELRRDHVSFINLTQLLNMSKSDAQVRLRLSDRVSVITSKVGPVGEFSLLYVLARAVHNPEDLLDRQSLRYDLRGWELVPVNERRGETFEVAQGPASQFSRALGRISPGSSTVTLWIYPDSFHLYRQLRDYLASHGYTVAARPLPEGMSIRGSPMGSLSAAQ